MQPFVEEPSLKHEVPQPLLRKHLSLSVFFLILASSAGCIIQAVIAWRNDLTLPSLYALLTWLAAFSLIALLRPKTARKGLLALYVSMVVAHSITLAESPPGPQVEVILVSVQIALGTIASLVILNMPLRDPQMPRDVISPLWSKPTFEFRSPEDDLTLWQFLSVSWMAPLIALGKERQLNDEDIWFLPYVFQHSILHDAFRETEGSVLGRLIRANIIDIVLLGLFGVIDLVANLALPILLQQLLQAMENPSSPRSAAITYAALSLVVRMVAAQNGIFSLWYGRRCYERSRGEMITMLYEKTLRRKMIGIHEGKAESEDSTLDETAEEHQETTQPEKASWYTRLFGTKRKATEVHPKARSKESASMGKVLNLLRGDAYEVAQRFWEVQSLFAKPLSVIFSIVLVWRMLGWPCLIGVLTILISQVLNIASARQLLKWERKRRVATDIKLQKVSQFVEAIRHLRWYGWQDTWQDEILAARQKELGIRIVTGLWNILIAITMELGGGLFPVGAFYGYTILAGKPLRVDVAFPALQIFTILEANLRELPDLITVILNAQVAMKRIQDFMDEPEMQQSWTSPGTEEEASTKPYSDDTVQQHPVSEGNAEGDDATNGKTATQMQLTASNASFAWPGAHKTVLTNVSLSFSPGLTVIYGAVGAGKTALLQALLGEMDLTSGELHRQNRMVGYCAQTPWLQSMSIRDNILFSAPFDESRYHEVLDACALTADLKNFKHGDHSYIGENGVGLSGGQRARVALARAIYSTAEILLLDDPVSALDHQTAEFIVKNCLTGRLTKDRTVILVTHRVELCNGLATQIIEVKQGRIQLLNPGTSDWVEDTGGIDAEQETRVGSKSNGIAVDAEKFIEEEHRAHGGVQSRIYWEYIKAGKLKTWTLLVIVLATFRMIDIAQSWYLKQWGEAYDKPVEIVDFQGPLDSLPSPEDDVRPWLLGYAILALVRASVFLLFRLCMLILVYFTGQRMFRDVMQRITHSTFRFYDITPVGRLMNRLTSDINTIDGNISGQFQAAAMFTISWISSLVVIGSITPIFLAFSFALTAAFILIFLRFLPTSQSLRRLEMVSLSPLMSNFGALVQGLTTVRAFCAQHRFQKRVIEVTDNFQKMDHFYWSLQAWLMYRFDALSACSTLALTLIAIYTGVSAGLTAFVLIAATQLVNATHALCRTYGQLQMDFVSVERVVELLHLEQEPTGTIDPPAWWPTQSGDIIFDNVTLRYAPHLEPSLIDVSLRIPAGSTTAVIGRTGSGKSTLATALLATILPSSGSITIDDISLASVNKQALRERVTFVAQDPVLFPGTMRQNLDPMNEYTDDECESVLEKVAGRFTWTLEFNIEPGGRNLSQGQRQLIGLARTILRRSSIIVLDEVGTFSS